MTSDRDPDAKPKPRASVRLGRRIFVIALVVYTLALCAAAVWSWWPAIFWPTPSPDARAAYRGVRCADGLVELRGRLDAELVRAARRQPPKIEPDSGRAGSVSSSDVWADWDDRHAALADACARPGADPEDAYAALYQLRHRYHAFVARFERDAVPLARRTDERIERAVEAAPVTTSQITRPRPADAVTILTSPAAAGQANGQRL